MAYSYAVTYYRISSIPPGAIREKPDWKACCDEKTKKRTSYMKQRISTKRTRYKLKEKLDMTAFMV